MKKFLTEDEQNVIRLHLEESRKKVGTCRICPFNNITSNVYWSYIEDRSICKNKCHKMFSYWERFKLRVFEVTCPCKILKPELVMERLHFQIYD